MSVRDDVSHLMEVAAHAQPPVRAIFHAAGINIDKVVPELDMDDYAKVEGVKPLLVGHDGGRLSMLWWDLIDRFWGEKLWAPGISMR